jgi:hypothetical protein
MAKRASVCAGIVAGIAFGLAWAGGCDRHRPGGAAAQGAGGTVLAVQATTTANTASWSLTGSGSSVESVATFAMPRAGTFSNLFVRPSTTLLPGASVTIAVRVNGANSPLAVTYTSADGVTTKSDTTTQVAVAQGALVTIEFRETMNVNPQVWFNATVVFN